MDQTTLVLSLLKLKDSNAEKVFNFIKMKGFDAKKCSLELDSFVSEEKTNEFKKVIASSCNDLTNGLINKIKCVTLFDKEFSPMLYDSNKKPCLHLFYKGNVNLLKEKCITVLGSDNVAQSYLDEAYFVGEEIARAGMTLVTDLSFGCNTAVINGCLSQGGKVIIVFSSDLHSVQPSENKDLVKRVLDYDGLIITEYPLGYPYSYSCRARKYELLSMISSMLIVIKASENHEIYNTIKKSLDDKKFVLGNESNQIDIVTNYCNINDLLAVKLIELYEGNLKELKGEQMVLF